VKTNGDRRKSRKSSKNLSGLSSGSKKSTQSDSDSNSDDEVRDELPILRQEIERLGSLLNNHHDKLREAKKMRKELTASLEDARTRVAELETQVLDLQA
jgi:predicted  nucleic acid-binding Zn-ribbon protein